MALTTPPERDDLNRALTRLKSLLRLDEDGIASVHDLCGALKTLGLMTDAVRARLDRIQEEEEELLGSLDDSESVSDAATTVSAPSPFPSSRSPSFRDSPTLGRSYTPLSQRRAGSRTSCLTSFPARPESSSSNGGLRELRLVSMNRRNSIISSSPSSSRLSRSPSLSIAETSSSPSNWDKDLTTLDTMLSSARKSLWRNRLDLPAGSNRRASLPAHHRSVSVPVVEEKEKEKLHEEQDQKLHQSALRKRNSLRALYRSDSPLARKPSIRSLSQDDVPKEDSPPGSPVEKDWEQRGEKTPSSTETRHSWDSGFAESPSPPSTPGGDDDASFSRLSTLLISMQAEAEAAVSTAKEKSTPAQDTDDEVTPITRAPPAPAHETIEEVAEPPKSPLAEKPEPQHSNPSTTTTTAPTSKRSSLALSRQPTLDLEVLVQELVVLQRGSGMLEMYAFLAGGGVLWLLVGWVLGWGCNECAASC